MYTVRATRDDELGKLTAVERSAAELFAGTAHAYLCNAPSRLPGSHSPAFLYDKTGAAD